MQSTINISIHALLAESDSFPRFLVGRINNFYPRSPCGERPPYQRYVRFCCADFYPRSPCGERLSALHHILKLFTISIHALLAESDSCTSIGRPKRLYFYPRSPCGERPSDKWQFKRYINISIHALLAESDTILKVYGYGENKFLSTLSLRRATPQQQQPLSTCQFLSTLSLRRATGQILTNFTRI